MTSICATSLHYAERALSCSVIVNWSVIPSNYLFGRFNYKSNSNFPTFKCHCFEQLLSHFSRLLIDTFFCSSSGADNSIILDHSATDFKAGLVAM